MQIRMLKTWAYDMDAAGTNRRTLPEGLTFDEPPEVAIAAIEAGAAERLDALGRDLGTEADDWGDDGDFDGDDGESLDPDEVARVLGRLKPAASPDPIETVTPPPAPVAEAGTTPTVIENGVPAPEAPIAEVTLPDQTDVEPQTPVVALAKPKRGRTGEAPVPAPADVVEPD